MNLIRCAARSDMGCRRENNEDSFAFATPQSPFWWAVVCDGMGGALAGEVASKLAVDTFRSAVSALAIGDLTPENISKIVHKAHRRVAEEAAGDERRTGMGTTLAAVVLDVQSGRAVMAHAGDSRIYLLRGDCIRRLTEDHNLGEDLIRSGAFPREEAFRIRNAAGLTRAVGVDPFPGAKTGVETLRDADVILLCSDGLTNVLKDEEIGRCVQAADLEASADRLIHRTREGGAPDNVTAVLARFESA